MSALDFEKRIHFRRESDRQVFQDALRFRQRFQDPGFEELADSVPGIVWAAQPDGIVDFFNRRWYDYTGLSPEQTKSWGWALVVHPDDLPRWMDAWDQAVDQGSGYEMECRLRRADGLFRWHIHQIVPLRNVDNQTVRWIGTSFDIHDSKRVQDRLETVARALTASEERLAQLNRSLERQVAERTEELRRKEEELQQTRKLEALGQLAGGVAHDFNNLLTGILGIAEQLNQEMSPDNPHRSDLSEVLKAGQRAFDLTRQLLAFGRRQVVALAVLDLNAVVRELEKMVSRLIREDIRLELRLQAERPTVQIDRGQLEQILINLVVNARDAMPDGGTLIIETDLIQATRTSPFGVDIQPGPYARLSIIDTGLGMDSGTLKRAFEPFFSTKGRERGTGLGLSTVYGIVKQNAGAISLNSSQGQGTRCDIYLPLVKDEPQPPIEESVSLPIARGGHETILVVEDEELVRRVVSNSLRKKGYRVLEAGHGQQALDISEHHAGPIDLVLTDVVMPEMNGRQLAERLKKQRPEAAILYMSGYAQDIVDAKGTLPPGTPFIEKPALVHTLTRKVREVLDARPPGRSVG